MSFIQELKRRNVFKVGIAYIVAAWLLLQLTEVLTELLDLPDVAGRFVVLILVIGFIPAIIFAWAFELTPEGIKREAEVDRSQSKTTHTGRRLNTWIIVMLVLALVYFVVDEFQDRAAEQAAAEMAAATAAVEQSSAPEPQTPLEPAIAVLPFTDLSPQGDQEYFSDGIAEELLNLLVRVKGLKVASRTSSFAFKGSSRSIADIAEELKVDHVLEGSVRKAENRVRITAQLIDTRTDRHLWSETYDRELDDIFAIQDDIANAIVQALRTELGVLADAGSIEVAQDTKNLDAYELYLQGRGLFLSRGLDNLQLSRRVLEQAVALDPEFARAWETLSAVYSVAESWGIRDQDYDELAMQAAERALALNPGLSLPYSVLGMKHAWVHGDYMKAMTYHDRAIGNDPQNATAWHWRGISLSDLGFLEQAISDHRKCLELDPFYSNCARHLALVQWAHGDEDQALDYFMKGIEKGYPGSEILVGIFLMRHGNRPAAALSLWSWEEADSSFPATDLLDAIQYPDSEHAARRARYLEWGKRKEAPLAQDQPLLAVVGAFDQIDARDNNTKVWMWLPGFEAFRAAHQFKRFLRQAGIETFWRERGFPPRCQALGDDDFECE